MAIIRSDIAASATSPMTVEEASEPLIPFFVLRKILTNSPVTFPVGKNLPDVCETHVITKHQ